MQRSTMRLSLGMPSMRAFVNNVHPRRSGGAEQNGYQESTYRRLSPGYHMSTCKIYYDPAWRQKSGYFFDTVGRLSLYVPEQ